MFIAKVEQDGGCDYTNFFRKFQKNFIKKFVKSKLNRIFVL